MSYDNSQVVELLKAKWASEQESLSNNPHEGFTQMPKAIGRLAHAAAVYAERMHEWETTPEAYRGRKPNYATIESNILRRGRGITAITPATQKRQSLKRRNQKAYRKMCKK